MQRSPLDFGPQPGIHAQSLSSLRQLASLAFSLFLLTAFMPASPLLLAQSKQIHAVQRFLNIPIGRQTKLRIFTINEGGSVKRTIPLQLADSTVDYWIYLDISEFKGKTISVSGPATQQALDSLYQAASIRDSATMYKEVNRPQFHLTVKRGWSNDVNGPIFFKGQYHLFWQAFPFGVQWDTGFMYWGHATSKDLVHWTELAPALMLDRLGSPWSGSSLIDHRNAAGFGKEALVLVYTVYDRQKKSRFRPLLTALTTAPPSPASKEIPFLIPTRRSAARTPVTRTSSGTPQLSTGLWSSLKKTACPSSIPAT
jgi:hypothetical protein